MHTVFKMSIYLRLLLMRKSFIKLQVLEYSLSKLSTGRKTIKELKILTCKRCGYQWVPRIVLKPSRCAKCKSMYWDDDRTMKIETAKKVSDYQKKRWKKIRKENGKKSPPLNRFFWQVPHCGTLSLIPYRP